MQSLIITILKSDERFPESLKAIGKDCPERIYAIGNLDLLKSIIYSTLNTMNPCGP